jgi:hypothetical protein
MCAGRRRLIIAFICRNLVPQHHEPFQVLDTHWLAPEPGKRIVIDGHCCNPNDFIHIDYFRVPLTTSNTNYENVPLVLENTVGFGLSLRFAPELQNCVGEADYSMFSTISRLPSDVIIDTIDTDSLLIALAYIWRLRQRRARVAAMNAVADPQPGEQTVTISITTRHARQTGIVKDGVKETETTYKTEFWKMNALYDELMAEFGGNSDAILQVLTALVAAGGDYVPNYPYVTHDRFWSAMRHHWRHIGTLCTLPQRPLATRWQDDAMQGDFHSNEEPEAPLQLDFAAFQQLIFVAYACANSSRLFYKDGTLRTTSLSVARLYLCDEHESSLSSGKSAKPLGKERWIPSDANLQLRFLNTRYAMMMMMQVGAATLHFDNEPDLLSQHGYARLDENEPMHYFNIRFAALEIKPAMEEEPPVGLPQ